MFKSARLTNNDLLSSYDNALGELEREICTVFGFTLDSPITESAFGIDNSGRITKDQMRWVYGGFAQQLIYSIKDSGGAEAIVRFVTGGVPVFGIGAPYVFAINMNNGAFIAGNTTQDASSNVLIPAVASASNLYYNGLGEFGQPGVVPFAGCVLKATGTTVAASNNDIQWWNEAGANPTPIDTGYFTQVSPTIVTVPTGGDGKYVVDVNLAFAAPTKLLSAIDVTIQIVKNAAITVATQNVYKTPADTIHHHVNLFDMIDLVATDTLQVNIINNCTQPVDFGVDPIAEGGTAKNGTFTLFRIE